MTELGHNLNELKVPEDVDQAAREAIWEEFALRQKSYRLAKGGLIVAVQALNEALVGLDGGGAVAGTIPYPTPQAGTVSPESICHCDRYGVVHVLTAECDLDYSGPEKPSPMSIYATQDSNQGAWKLDEEQGP